VLPHGPAPQRQPTEEPDDPPARGKETPGDLHALADVLLYYQRVLADAHTDIERLCAAMPHAEPMAPRVKTLKTTLEKMQSCSTKLIRSMLVNAYPL